ncbi:MAG: exo-alpha-sialidase [Gorillibacterium sp.]|nr:exo-alpha-sialidase [Gorillibacterium sp.]
MNHKHEPLIFTGKERANADYHDGQLRPVVGVHNFQALRVNREHPEWSDGLGWTYSPAPFLAFWNHRFYLHHYMNQLEEHTPPTLTMLMTSTDGRTWSKPEILFPTYVVPAGVSKAGWENVDTSGMYSVMHQRMGFYIAPDGRLLALGYYAIVLDNIHDHPNDGKGMGRVVREIYSDGSFSEIYFIRYNSSAGWNETNTSFPFFTASTDEGFRSACQSLLEDRLMVQQWAEESDRDDPLINTRNPDAPSGIPKAFCWYTLPDGKTVGLWKFSKAAISEDKGETWGPFSDIPSFVMSGAKVWGQQTTDGRYAIVYNPVPDGEHRWPLAVTVSEDGLNFNKLLTVHGEVPPRRYSGLYKDFGPGYNRGIEEGNGVPADGNMWLTYTVNKEDLWVSRIPVPIRDRVDTPVNDDFANFPLGGFVQDWNLYCPLWAPIQVIETERQRVLELSDSDPCDYAKAVRVFPESTRATVAFTIQAKQMEHGLLHIELQDAQGINAVRIALGAGGVLDPHAANEHKYSYQKDEWLDIQLKFDTYNRTVDLEVNGHSIPYVYFRRTAATLERIVFRTGKARRDPNPETDRHAVPDLANVSEPAVKAAYWIGSLRTFDHQS